MKIWPEKGQNQGEEHPPKILGFFHVCLPQPRGKTQGRSPRGVMEE